MLTHLVNRLERSRVRARNLLLLQGALWSALAAGSSYLALRLVGLWRPLPLPAWVWATLIFAGALIGSSTWALLRTPGLLELARRADRTFGLRERSSTALELALVPGGSEGELATALLADAERHALVIEPQCLVLIRFPRVGWWLAALAAGLGGFQFVVPLVISESLPGPPSASEEIAVPLSPEERGETVADLLRTATLLGGEAEQRKDPYLQALAQAFDDLSRRVASGALDRATTERELDRLLNHVERAYEGESAPFGRAASAPGMPDTESPADPLAEAQGSPAAVAAPLKERPPEEPRSSESSALDTTAGLNDLLDELEQVGTNLQRATKERETNKGRITAVDYAEFGPYITPESLERLKRQREEREAQQARAGQPIGAAQEANKGAGDLAGEGVQPLAGGEERTALEASKIRREQVSLPDSRTEAGEHVQLERPPDTRLSDVADSQRPSGEAWRASREAEVRRDQLGPRERAVVSRYFNRGGPGSPTRSP